MLAVLSDDPGLLHQSAQTVVGVDALLSVAIDAPDHLIGLVIGVRAGSGDLLGEWERGSLLKTYEAECQEFILKKQKYHLYE